MKMADAFAKQVDSFMLVTGGGLFSSKYSVVDCSEWYGVRNHFKIVRLPVFFRLKTPLFTGWKYPRFDRVAAFYARIKSPDVVFTRSAYAGRLCVNFGLNTIIEIHMGVKNSELFHIDYVKHKPELLGVVTVTDTLKELYIQENLPSDKIFVWPDAVDLDAFDRLPEKPCLRQRLDLPQQSFIATYCGHFYHDRGIEEILYCAAQLPDVQFLLIGGWKRDIEKYKEEVLHLDNVNFRGFVSNQRVPEYLAASNVLLMPYRDCESKEGIRSPLKMFEYMASGCPIVATDLPALSKHLKHAQNALLIKPGDPGALVAAIKQIMSNKKYAIQLAQTARVDVSPYTWHNRARAILSRFCSDNRYVN
jgi:glycosyltransferase involved in cell wall biosynthesis